jgi:UDP-N-acetylmuramoyl-tripeptide--D-alanyl-D-alanine ligase
MKTLWTDSEAAYATSGKADGLWEAAHVEIDSRKVTKGDLFVALKGEHFDGHTYVADALSKGAVAAMVSHVPDGVKPVSLLQLDDTLKGLELLGKAGRKRSTAKIVGVTGSVGKTSAKEMIKLVLAAHGDTYATTGNYNNHIGTPLSLANLPVDARFGVFEMGMNHAGEISHLTKMVKPDVAIITNVEAVHIEFFRSIEGIANAKSEIFEGMKPSGIAILNRDSAHYALMGRRADERSIKNIITFGEHEKSDCRLIHYQSTEHGCAIEASIFGKRLHYTLKAVGRHWAMLSLITLAVTQAFSLDDEVTIKALAGFSEVDGRGRVIIIPVMDGQTYLIDDSYNASPAAMRAAFAKTVEVWEGKQRKGRKIAVLGNMLELGADSAALHAELAHDIEDCYFDAVFTAGEWMKYLHDTLPLSLRAGHVAQAKDLLAPLQMALRDGDIVLVKGSHGSKMYELVESLKATVTNRKDKVHAV